MSEPGGAREQRIREVAYLIWLDEGRPHGRDFDHWTRAVALVAAEEAVPARPPAARAKAPEPVAKAAGSVAKAAEIVPKPAKPKARKAPAKR